MRGIYSCILLVFLICGQALTVVAAEPSQTADAPQRAFVPGEVLVKFKPPVEGQAYPQSLDTAATVLSEKEGLDIKSQQETSGIVLYTKPGADVEKLVSDLKKDPAVQMAQPNYIYTLRDETIPSTIGSNNEEDSGVNAAQVWGVSTGKGVVVAVIDSGIDYTDADLRDNIWINAGETDCTDGIDNDTNGYIDDCKGWDFTGADAYSRAPDNDPMPEQGHGTHVAQIIAAANNGAGTVGVAPEATLMPVKIIDSTGLTPTDAIIEAIYYAIDNGADVINTSFGNMEYDSFEHDAIKAANKAGIVVVASAGNEGRNIPKYPAAYPEAIAVSALDSKNQASGSSNYGEWVSLAAPGNFTSFATPHVSGVAALVIQKNPDLHPAEIRYILEKSARDLGAPGKDDIYGYGLVDAYAALFPPRLTFVSMVPETANSPTPAFILNSTEAGGIIFTGSCGSAQTSVIDGQTQITLKQLNNGTYSDCRLTVTDALGKTSAELALPVITVGKPLDATDTESVKSSEPVFGDLDDHWGKAFILALAERKAVKGFSDGNFHPNNPVTRAEALKIALLGFGHPIIFDSPASPFVDVKSSAWYQPYIATAKAAGITNGFADNTFRPNAPVSRAEALKLISASAGIPAAELGGKSIPFRDVPAGAWYLPYIRWAVQEAIISGYSNGTFAPDNAITRAEFSKVMYLTLKTLGR